MVQLKPAASKITAKAAGFIGQAMISPALWIKRISAPALSQGVFTERPVFSETSSSMNCTLSFTTRLFMPVERSHLELQHRAVLVVSPAADAHLLAEELADFVGHQRASSTPIGQSFPRPHAPIAPRPTVFANQFFEVFDNFGLIETHIGPPYLPGLLVPAFPLPVSLTPPYPLFGGLRGPVIRK